MFKVMMLPDSEKFLTAVDKSQGQVLLHLTDNVCYDLKQDNQARQLIRSMLGEGLCVSLSEPADVPAFIDYMIGSAYDRRCYP